jgi:hypothetical protein
MTEQELRQLVRSVIAGQQSIQAPSATVSWRSASAGPPDPTVIPLPIVRDHASHAQFVIPAPGDACVIEPSVVCNHCGYCKSYGH